MPLPSDIKPRTSNEPLKKVHADDYTADKYWRSLRKKIAKGASLKTTQPRNYGR